MLAGSFSILLAEVQRYLRADTTSMRARCQVTERFDNPLGDALARLSSSAATFELMHDAAGGASAGSSVQEPQTSGLL